MPAESAKSSGSPGGTEAKVGTTGTATGAASRPLTLTSTRSPTPKPGPGEAVRRQGQLNVAETVHRQGLNLSQPRAHPTMRGGQPDETGHGHRRTSRDRLEAGREAGGRGDEEVTAMERG